MNLEFIVYITGEVASSDAPSDSEDEDRRDNSAAGRDGIK